MTKNQIIVTAAIIEKEGHFLVALRPMGDKHGGLWEFPGGKVEPGESQQECLKREIAEELGISIEVQDLRIVSSHEDETVRIELHSYRARLLSGEPEPREHAALRWIAPPHFCEIEWSPADLPVVQMLMDEHEAGRADS